MLKRGTLILVTLLLVGIPSTFAFAQPSYPSIHPGTSNDLPVITPTPLPADATPSGPPLSLTLSLLCFCLVFSLLIGVFVLGVMVRMPGRKDKDVEKVKEEHGL